MAGMVVTTTEKTWTSVREISFAWTADSVTGAATGATTAPFDGQALALITDPSGGGTQPDDNYDVTITDASGIDILNGLGANRDETNTELVLSTAAAPFAPVAGSVLTVNIANAGVSNAGVAILRIR